MALLRSLYADAQPHSISLLVMSTLTDVAAFVREDESRFVMNTSSVILVGGVDAASMDSSSDALRPDGHNHTLDPDASQYVFERCQALGVRLIVVAREAALAASSMHCRIREAAIETDETAETARCEMLAASY